MKIGLDIRLKHGVLWTSMQRKNVTGKWLADALGVSTVTVSRWTRMKGFPKKLTERQVAILEALCDCPIDEIWTEEQRENQALRTMKTRFRSVVECDPEVLIEHTSGRQALLLDPETEAIYSQGREIIADVLGSLTAREQRVIEMRFYEGKTFDQCGEEVGVTKERVRQIETCALNKLKGPRRRKRLLDAVEALNSPKVISREEPDAR